MLITSAPLVGGAAKPTTDALKQATDRLLKEQQLALQKAATYKSQLGEANNYVSRLEKAYQAETHREQLAKSRADAENVAKKLSKELSETNVEVQDLRTGLSEALQKCTAFEAQLKASSEEMVAHKASAENRAAFLSSALEEAKAELSAAKCTFAEQEHALRLQLGTATSNAADLSSKYEEKVNLLQKLEDELCFVAAQKDAFSKDLEESSTLAASLKSSFEEATKEAATAAAKVAELEVQLASEKQRYEQLSQQSDADRTAAAMAMEEATKKFSVDLAEALKNAKSDSEKELGAERERISMEIARMQAEHTAKLDSLTTDLAAATKQTAADEKEKARLENLLDERNLLISQLEEKCSERAAEIANLQQNLTVAAHEAMSTAEKAAKLQQELEEITEELEEKRVALESISAFAGKQNNISSAAPTAPPSAIKKRRAASSPPPAHNNPRIKHKARFNENPISRTLILEDEDLQQEEEPQQPYQSEPQEDDAWDFNTDGNPDDDDDEEDEEVDEEALRTALVVHTAGRPTNQAGSRPMRQARMRQSHVVVEEVSDTSSDDESYEIPPRSLHRNKAPAAKPVKPCIKPTAGYSRPAPKSRLAAMRPANSFKPSHTARGRAAKVVSKNRGGGGGGGYGSQQPASQNHTLFNLFGGLGNASPGDT